MVSRRTVVVGLQAIEWAESKRRYDRKLNLYGRALVKLVEVDDAHHDLLEAEAALLAAVDDAAAT